MSDYSTLNTGFILQATQMNNYTHIMKL